MRILHVISSLRTGGAEHLMVDLLPRLHNMGNDVELLLIDGVRTFYYEQLEQSGVKLHNLSINRNVYHPANLIKIIRFFKKNKYDVIHTHTTAPQLFAAIGSLLCSVVLVTTEHNTSNRRRNWNWYALIDRWMYGRYKRIICITKETKSQLETHIGDRNNICIINNGIDFERFHLPINNIEFKNNYILAMVASLRNSKDQDTIIKALELLPENFKLWLIGDGPRRNILEQLTMEYNVSDRVSFKGICTEIPKLLSDVDFVVHSSHWEGFGLAAVEGMAAGRPVIAADVPGLGDIVKGYGVTFPHGNCEVLKEEILKLSNDPVLYHRIAERCQERAKQFDICVMAEKYNLLYEELQV